MVVSGLYVGFHDEAWQTEANNLLHPLAHAWTDHAWNDMADAVTYSILLPQAYAQTPDPDAFVTTWNVTRTPVASTINAASVRFSIGVAPGGQVTIDWGNGNSPKTYNATGYATNAYLNKQPTMSKNATVVISGDLEHFYFHYTDPVTTNDSPQLLLSIDQWGDTEWSDMTEIFRGAVNMQYKADKNAAKNILDNDCLHTEETGGQAHGNRGGTIAGVEVVTRREDHGSDSSGMNNSTGRLGPDNDDDNIGRSDRAPERASGHATERSVCTNFRSPL